MKAFVAVYMVIMTCGLTHSYSAKRRNTNNMFAVPMAAYTPQISPQYYDRSGSSSNTYLQPQSQYVSSPYLQSQPQQQQQQPPQRVADDYNRNYYYATNTNQQQQRDYQEPLYGYPTFHGDYNPKPYYFAQPSYAQDERMEQTNPLDYLQAEIFQENERERNNAAFMQNLALYNQKLDSLKDRQQQLQQFENAYNLKPSTEFDDYSDVEQPSDWYDSTSILVEPNTFDNYISIPSEPQFQYQQWQPQSPDYDDEMVKELRELKQQRKNAKKGKQQQKQQQRVKSYSNLDWQQDMPQASNDEEEDVIEPENYDDEWINWGGQKRSIQPKKDAGDIKGTSTISPSTTSTEKSKIIAKLHSKTSGQKEVVLPRPATPVRRPFSEAIMKSMEGQDIKSEQQKTPPIYRTIKQIIDMEQNLSHVSKKFLRSRALKHSRHKCER